eukprot:1128494-Alexandrium_andersonii.AAC.1
MSISRAWGSGAGPECTARVATSREDTGAAADGIEYKLPARSRACKWSPIALRSTASSENCSR